MSGVLEAALAYAARGWAVFPVHGIVRRRCTCGRRDCSRPGKHPLTKNGLHDATSEAPAVRDWWTRWSRANVAVATGHISELVVIDLDLPRGMDSIERLIDRIPPTLTGLTGGGGLHLLFHAAGKTLRCTTARVPGLGALPGIDVRGDGGYVVLPPSLHRSGERYAWLDCSRPVVSAPTWMRDRVLQRRPVTRTPPKFKGDDGTAYGRAALQNAIASLRSAPIGQRNDTLNRVAFRVAQLVASGDLLELPSREALYAQAMATGLTAQECRRTIASAFDAGSRA